MNVLKLSLMLLAVAIFLGCRQEDESGLPRPDPFEMTISTISKQASIEDAEITKRETLGFSNLEEVQNRLRSLDWQNTDLRYEVEIIRREDPKPEAKMEIKHVGETPRSTEFLFRKDLAKPNDKTRVEVGEGMTADMVAIMTGQFFEHKSESPEQGAK